MPTIDKNVKLNHDMVAEIFVAQDGRKVAASKHKELAVQFFYERYKSMPTHVLSCPYIITDSLLVKTQ